MRGTSCFMIGLGSSRDISSFYFELPSEYCFHNDSITAHFMSLIAMNAWNERNGIHVYISHPRPDAIGSRLATQVCPTRMCIVAYCTPLTVQHSIQRQARGKRCSIFWRLSVCVITSVPFCTASVLDTCTHIVMMTHSERRSLRHRVGSQFQFQPIKL